VEVAYSLISTGTELSGVQSSGQSLLEKALNQPEKIRRVLGFYKSQGIQKTLAKIQGQIEQVSPKRDCAGKREKAGRVISFNTVRTLANARILRTSKSYQG
jgi:hypothetical protein